MVSKTVLCKVGSVALFLVGAGLFIFGFLVIGTVDDLLKDGVKKSLKLESGDIDEKFINSTNVKYYAYVYNISNWDQFAAGTALPTYNLLGPYIYQEYAIKYNMSFSDDGTTFKYNEYWIYEPLTDRATTDVVYTANLVFGGLFGGFYQSLQAGLSPTNAAFAAGIRPDSLLDESKLLGHTLLPSVHPVAADQFAKKDLIPVAAANTFRGFLPATTFGTYIDALLGTLAIVCPPPTANISTYDDLATQWATKSLFPAGLSTCHPALANFAGFEIGGVPASVGIALFNTTSAASFRSSAGQQAWAAAIAGDATANAGLNASLSVLFTPIKNHLNQLWFNNTGYEKAVVAAISGPGGLSKGFVGGKWTAPELIATGALLNSTDFINVLGEDSILTRYTGLWSASSLNATSYGEGFDRLAALQFSTGALTASTQASTFLTTTLKALFGLNGVGANAVNLDGLEYARYMGKTLVDQFNAGGSAKDTIIANNAACQPFLTFSHPLNVSRFLGCVYMDNALSIPQARAILNKNTLTSTGIVTWSIVRVSLLYPNTTIRAQTINGLLGLTATDPIPKEKIDQLSNYFCYELPLAVYKGRMFLNSGYTDYKTGGLFRKLTPDKVFRGYTDQFVPAAVAPGFFASTLASYTTQETAFAASPYSPHELYTGTSDIQKARWWKSYRGVSNLTTWEDTYVEDISISEVASRTTRLTEAQRIIPRDGGKVWKTSEIIDGTSDGKTAGPFQEDNQVEERNNLYVSQARRSARLYKTGEVTTFKGIKLVRYRFNVKTVQNATTNTDNDKYYMSKPYATSQFSCPNGLVPLQRMARGAPVFLSQAGFYNVDPSVTAPYSISQTLFDVPDEAFSSANTDRWDTYLDMEPFSGATMRAHKRLQVNMWLPKTWFKPQAAVIPTAATGFQPGPDSQVHANFFNQVPNDSAPSGVPDTKSNLFVPISIYDENGEILDDDAKTFRQKIYDNRDLADNLRIIFIVVGAFFMIVALGCLYHFSRKTGMDRLESKADLTN